MTVAKSPFYVVPDFLTPKNCEVIVDNLGLYNPDVDSEGNPIRMIRGHEGAEQHIYNKFQYFIPVLEKYYGFEHLGTEPTVFEVYPEGFVPSVQCENSSWVKKKWMRTKDRDFTAVLFLSDYQDKIPFDSDYEVYGGKLEFPQHQFGFNPQRGTLIVYPSDPHFINAIAEVAAGELYIAKFHIAATKPYLYNPAQFPGDYRTWFANL